MTPKNKKKLEVLLTIRVSRSTHDRLIKRAEVASRRSGTNIKTSTIARGVLEEHA
jgi:hypothetical protein